MSDGRHEGIEAKIIRAIELGEWPDPDGPTDFELIVATELGYDLATLGFGGDGEGPSVE